MRYGVKRTYKMRSVRLPPLYKREYAGEMKASSSVRLATGALALAMLLPSLGTSIAHVGLPTLREAFGATFGQVQWVVLAYLLGMTGLSVSAGRLGDRWGSRGVLQAGIWVFTLAAGLGGAAEGLGALVAARAMQGAGAAAMLALALALAGELAGRERLGATIGLLGTMSAVGTALGPSLGGWLLSAWGWRAIFFAQVPLGLLAFALACSLPATRPCLPVTVLRPSAGRWLRDRELSAPLLAAALVATVLMTTLVAGPFYLAETLNLDAARSGLVLSAGPLVAALCGVPAGRVVDRLGAGPTAVGGLAAIFAGAAGLTLALPHGGVSVYLAGIVTITAGYAFFQTANNAAVLGKASAFDRGVRSGLLNLMRNGGLIAGASGMGAVYSALGMKAALAVASGLALLALGLVGWGRREQGSKIAQNSPSFRSA